MNNRFLNPTARFIILLSLIVLLWFLARAFEFNIAAMRLWLAQYPLVLSGFFFIALYVGLTSLLWVGTMDLFRISGAILFGAYWGTLFIWIAEIIIAAILFTISRKLGQEFVLQKLGMKKGSLDYGKRHSGFWSAFVLRINPLVPFRFMDLGFGLSKIQFDKYMWAVVLGSPMRIFMVQFILAGIGEAIIHQGPKAMFDYLMVHQNVLILSALYILGVVIITLVAVVKGLIEHNLRKKK